MISEDFISLINDFDTSSSTEDIIAFNELIAQLATKQNNEAQSYFFRTFAQISDHYIISIRKDSFQWNNAIGSELKEFFTNFSSLKSPMYIELSNTSFIHSLFDIRFFSLFCKVNIGRVGGTPHYDQALRAMSYMLKFFANVYLRKVLAFKPSLKTKNFHLYDPCFREKVREMNLADPDIQSSFFSKAFDVKEFVMLCLNTYFPNVSWRWLGGNQFAHYVSLKMVLILFEYGLWKLEELDALLAKIYSVSEILSNLETAIQKDCNKPDNKLSQATMEDYTRICAKCRKKIGSILLHIVIIHLDVEVISVLPHFKIPIVPNFSTYPIIKPKTDALIENLFYVKRFKKKRLYTYFTYSLITYLVRVMKFRANLKPINSKSLRAIIALLVGCVSDMENNMFNISLNSFQPQACSFYLISASSELYSIPAKYKTKLQGIVEGIKNCGYGVLNYQNFKFLNDIRDSFKEIIAFFDGLPLKIEVNHGFQIAFVLHSVPQLILSLMHFVMEFGPQEQNVYFVIRVGVLALISICRENNQAINNIFSGFNAKHISELLDRDIVNGAYLIVKLFGPSSTMYILEKNHDLFGLLINKYMRLLEDFTEGIEGWDGSGPVEVKPSTMVALMMYSKLFKRILKNSQQKSFKFEILIGESMEQQMAAYLKLLSSKTIRVSTRFEDNPLAGAKIENFLSLFKSWEFLSTEDKTSGLYQAVYLILALFDIAIKRVYTEKIYSKFKNFFTQNSLTTYKSLLSTKFGLKLLKTVINIFSSIMIFQQNHLLNRDCLHIKKNDAFIEEYIVDEQINCYIYEELASFVEPVKVLMTVNAGHDVVRNFLLAGFMPAIFKLYSGLLTHMTEKTFKEIGNAQRLKFFSYIKIFLELAITVKEYLERTEGVRIITPATNIFIASFNELYKNTDSEYFFRQTLNAEVDTFRLIGYQLSHTIIWLYLYDESKIPHVSELIRYNYYKFDQSILEHMEAKLEFLLKFRNEVKRGPRRKLVFWDNSKKSIEAFKAMQAEINSDMGVYFKIKNFDFTMPDDNNTKYVKIEDDPDALTCSLPPKNVQAKAKDTSFDDKSIYISKVLSYLKERYWFMKAYFLDNNHNNQIFIIFRLEDIIKQNVQIFVEYFFEQISMMDLAFEDMEENFFTNERYFSLFILMDNLVRTSPAYRSTLYDKINQSTDPLIVRKIWVLHRMLLDYCLYSTFLDTAWKQNFTSYFLISNFIQNLCEDNYFLFKRFFYYWRSYTDNHNSLIEAYYSYLQTAFKNTELFQYSREQLTVTDKPELFFVYNRLVEGMAEFINGGKTFGQTILYEKRIDIWVGIIMRLVDNMDSPFYTLKYNILLYISGMIEGSDKKIIEFIASNFSVSRTLNLIVRLIKKLYIRAFIVKKKKRQIKFGTRGTASTVFLITKEDEKNYSIENENAIMEFYKKYESTFADHVIMNTVVTLYSFILKMSVWVVRYKNFVEEINQIEQIVFVDHRAFQNEAYDMESIHVWHFIKSIIVQIEILYRDVAAEDNPPPKLILHHFKKLPVCFFLTPSLRDNFRFYVKVDSLMVKHDEFFEKAKYHIIMIRDLRLLYKKSKFLFFASTSGAFRAYMMYLYLLAITINILLLTLYSDPHKNFFQWNPLENHLSIVVVSAINIASAFAFLVFWFIIKLPTEKRIEWEEFFQINKRQKPTLKEILKISFVRACFKKRNFRTFFTHIALTLLGLFVSPFFYTLLLTVIVDLSFLVFTVVISFIKNYDKLAYTLLMILIVVNFFAFSASNFFEGSFPQNENSVSLCSTYFTCLINGVNIGLRAGGGFADKMLMTSDNHARSFEGRFFFDVMFFILINIILVGMFFGIIVDSFKEYRNMLEVRRNDEENVCFTCGLEKSRLEKAGFNFDQHIAYHDVWNYLFYIIYLEWKPTNSYDGIDLYVKDKIDMNKRNEWMPIKKTIGYEKEVGADDSE